MHQYLEFLKQNESVENWNSALESATTFFLATSPDQREGPLRCLCAPIIMQTPVTPRAWGFS